MVKDGSGCTAVRPTFKADNIEVCSPPMPGKFVAIENRLSSELERSTLEMKIDRLLGRSILEMKSQAKWFEPQCRNML